ncbi:hypothetical protein FRC03_003571 [Tulasnella sp. 419]|nr:hypothetical protein FRC02_001398 [Tulasnella sp. 418]KAG8962954.1 hypothetical protein FRC03_003571 [Tulasnella sp. 419]
MDVSKYGATNLIDFYITLVGQNYTSQLCAIAGLAWIVYDYFITLDMEINLVWRRSGTKSKLLYLFTRYYGIAFLTYDFTVVLHSGWSVHVSTFQSSTRSSCRPLLVQL